MDVISNNIANAATAGYKSQATAEMSFGAHLVSRLSASPANSQVNIGPGAFMTVNTGTYSDFTQGMLESTGRNVDMAIQGKAFWWKAKIQEVLTRNGQFEIDGDGIWRCPVWAKCSMTGAGNQHRGNNFSVGADGTLLRERKGRGHPVYRRGRRGFPDDDGGPASTSAKAVTGEPMRVLPHYTRLH